VLSILIVLSSAAALVTFKPEVFALEFPARALRGRPGTSAQTTPWGIQRIGAPDAWSISTGVDVQVAVLDTGIDASHDDLADKVVWGICVVGTTESTNPRDWRDKNGHGTHVAGTIAALNNDIGVVGVAYGVELYAIKVLNDAGFGDWEDIIEGIWWAIKGPDGIIDKDGDGIVAGDPDDDAAEVISMSLGGYSDIPELHDAIIAAYNYGIVVVAAAGNDGYPYPCYPAAYPEVIAVGAIDDTDSVPDWSNRNPELVAPGVDILSTLPRDRYGTYSGTSMATPHVSGTVALMFSAALAKGYIPTPDYIRSVLRETADDIYDAGYDSLSGYGVVRADLATAAM